jgi:ABC-2 type transport system permease protein
MQLFSLSNKAMKDFFRLVKVEFSRIFSMFCSPFYWRTYILWGFICHCPSTRKVVNLPIVIVDQDNSPASDKIIDVFSDNEVLLVSDVRYTPGNILAVTKQYAVITLPTHF